MILPTQHLSFVPELADRLSSCREVECRGGLPRHNYEMGVVDKLGAVGAIDLSEHPLYAVADNGVAHPSRNHDTEFAALTFPPDHETDKCAPDPFPAFFVDRGELGSAP